MTADLRSALDTLERTPAVLDSLLRGLDPRRQTVDEGPGTWSARDVVGHLVHGEETDWVPRATTILEAGEGRPFEPFEREAHRRRFADRPIDELLDLFALRRRENLETVVGWNLSVSDLDRRGSHPELGRVTLGQLMTAWAVHDLGHLAQVSRVLARDLGDGVGAWRAYLGILGDGSR